MAPEAQRSEGPGSRKAGEREKMPRIQVSTCPLVMHFSLLWTPFLASLICFKNERMNNISNELNDQERKGHNNPLYLSMQGP